MNKPGAQTLNVRRISFTIVGSLLLLVFAYGVLVALRGAGRFLTSLDSDLAVAIIAAAATALISVLSIVLGKAYESRALVQKEHREKKIPVYEDLIKFMFRVFMGTETGSKPTNKEVWVFMSDFNQRLMVWGSDDVFAAWVKWRRAALSEADEKAEPAELMLLYEQLIFTIRRDLGHRNKNLVKGDVLALFVNDTDQALKEKNS